MTNNNNNNANDKDITKKEKWVLKYIILYSVITVLIFIFSLIWQGELSFLTINIALYITGALFFATSWFMLMNNKHLFTSVGYGFRSLSRRMTGKTMQQDFYEYRESKTPIKNRVILFTFILSLVIIAIAIITHIVFL